MCSLRWRATWRSVSATKPRLQRSPIRPAPAPIRYEPAYHSGLSTLGRLPSCCQPVFAPGEMVGFFPRCFVHGRAHLLQTGGGGLAPIQALSGHFPGVVDPHQAGDMTPIFGVIQGLVKIAARRFARGSRRRREHRAQGLVGASDEMIQRAVFAIHAFDYSNGPGPPRLNPSRPMREPPVRRHAGPGADRRRRRGHHRDAARSRCWW